MKNGKTNYSSLKKVTYNLKKKKIILPLGKNIIDVLIKFQCFKL